MLSLTPDVRFVCIYLYTNSHISLTNVYKIPVQLIQLETGYDISTIKIILDKLQELEILKHFNYLWVQLLRDDFASLEYSGSLNNKAIEKYKKDIPLEIREFFNIDSSIDTSIHTSNKSEIINNKLEIRNKKPEKVDITKYKPDFLKVKDSVYKKGIISKVGQITTDDIN